MSDSFVLPQGITGFSDNLSSAPPSVDVKLFKVAAYEAARSLSATFLNFTDSSIAVEPNFHIAEIQMLNEIVVGVLCNRHFGYIAFAKAPVTFSYLAFIDAPALKEIFEQFGYVVLPASLLNTYPDKTFLTELSAAEQKQIVAWKPSRLGDIIFNFWD